MLISIIVAMDQGRGIGYQGSIPWHLPDDLKHFRRLTMGHHVIMGRRTFESIGRPLEGRRMVVLSRKADWQPPEGVERASSLEEAVALAEGRGEEETFIAGGVEVYRRALPLAARMYITRVEARLPADTRFPQTDWRSWRLLDVTPHRADARHAHRFRFEIWEKVLDAVGRA